MKKLYTILTVILLFATLSIQSQSILLVNDNGKNPERADALKTALNDLGLPFSYFNTVDKNASPTADFMDDFDVVIWYTGNDSGGLYLWNASDTVNTELKTYLDNGGMLWLQGLDFLYDLYKGAPDTFSVGDFVYDYLGISTYVAQSHKDDGVYSDGVPFFEVDTANGIFSLDTLKWHWATMYFADAMIPTDSAKALYKMGPAEYDLGGYAGAIYNESGEAKIMTFATETGKLDAQWRLDTLYAQGLRYFKQFAKKETKFVESITLSTDGNKTTIDTKGGSLQFSTTVLPDDATDKNVVWSLENNTCFAAIDQNGLLTTSPVSFGNGTVTVVATASDGSGVKASMDITISNQGDASDFEVLLVADGNWSGKGGLTRYLELDTALINNNINKLVYRTVETDDIPTLDMLQAFDVVIWYTSNDQTNLKIWDVSDSSNIKFNAPLMTYLDNGGLLWVQGTDYLYDIYGNPPVADFKVGDFVYDYLGIKTYVAKSHTDADSKKGVPQLDVVLDNGICELDPIEWSYSKLWRVDAYALTDDALGIYKLGPSDYILNPFYAMVYKKNGKSRIITSAFETARLDDQDNLDQLFQEVLAFFESITNDVNEIKGYVSDIEIYPNPVQNHTILSYDLAKKANVKLLIYSIDGQIVYNRDLGSQIQGKYSIDISTNGLKNGTYLCAFKVDDKQITKKILVVK